MSYVWLACFDSWHHLTSGDSIGIDVFAKDPMDSIRRLPTLLSKYCLHFWFHVMTRLQVTQTGVPIQILMMIFRNFPNSADAAACDW